MYMVKIDQQSVFYATRHKLKLNLTNSDFRLVLFARALIHLMHLIYMLNAVITKQINNKIILSLRT